MSGSELGRGFARVLGQPSCPFTLIKQARQANGASKNRSLGRLTMILKWRAFDGKTGNLLNQLLRRRKRCRMRDDSGAKLEGHIKLAVLMKCEFQWRWAGSSRRTRRKDR